MVVDLINRIFKDNNEIIENLYIGCHDTVKKYSNNFDVIINVTPNIPFYGTNKYKYRIPVLDNLSMSSCISLFLYSKRIIPIIHKHLQHKSKVLVHCRAGMQRSATLVAIYLMMYYNMSLDGSIKYIKNKRTIAFLLFPHFFHTLHMVESFKKHYI